MQHLFNFADRELGVIPLIDLSVLAITLLTVQITYA